MTPANLRPSLECFPCELFFYVAEFFGQRDSPWCELAIRDHRAVPRISQAIPDDVVSTSQEREVFPSKLFTF